jgi:hypothetical protein
MSMITRPAVCALFGRRPFRMYQLTSIRMRGWEEGLFPLALRVQRQRGYSAFPTRILPELLCGSGLTTFECWEVSHLFNVLGSRRTRVIE